MGKVLMRLIISDIKDESEIECIKIVHIQGINRIMKKIISGYIVKNKEQK